MHIQKLYKTWALDMHMKILHETGQGSTNPLHIYTLPSVLSNIIGERMK